MTRFSSSLFGILALCAVPTIATAQAGAKAAITLDEAALAGEVKTDQRVMIAPESGKQFVWVKATLAGAPQTIDLTKVAIAGASASYPLVGVDSVFGGDPSQFSMISTVTLKTGKTWDPLEETRSDGSIKFAFTPGKLATLQVITPPQSFCLLFVVPSTFKTGTVTGLAADAKPLPALTAKP